MLNMIIFYLGILEGFVPLKLSAKNTSSASITPSTYPLPKNVLIQSRILCLQKKLVASAFFG